MKILKILLLTVLLFSCVQGERDNIRNGEQPSNSSMYSSVNYSITIKEIDGCEYIILDGSQKGDIEHKANCRNSEHDF